MAKEIVPDTIKLIYEDDGDIIFKPVVPNKKKGGDLNALPLKTDAVAGTLTGENQPLSIVSIPATINKE